MGDMKILIQRPVQGEQQEFKLELTLSDAAVIATTSVIFASIAAVRICRVFRPKKK